MTQYWNDPVYEDRSYHKTCRSLTTDTRTFLKTIQEAVNEFCIPADASTSEYLVYSLALN